MTHQWRLKFDRRYQLQHEVNVVVAVAGASEDPDASIAVHIATHTQGWFAGMLGGVGLLSKQGAP